MTERAIGADPGARGDMILVRVADRTERKLADPNDAQMKPIIPVLYHARLTTMHGNRMLF
ncbi:hypothetical protein CR105_27025 [Massilia eurypsychrophila]|uniref:Uncharacterized protein n=1 Tax=Massilia eurypsychrophila TaxID=1485217 RepID=A0A2G8T7B8_9BURK|nr:hypothetical protein CR105_27025 [Massilia eurypsychrophila]